MIDALADIIWHPKKETCVLPINIVSMHWARIQPLHSPITVQVSHGGKSDGYE